MSLTTPQHSTERFTQNPHEKECSTKGCNSTVRSRDKLKRKCSQCVEKELERERRLDADLNRTEVAN